MAEYLGSITLVNVQDGDRGPAGPQGPSGDQDAYRIETNQEEILKFVVQDTESEDGTKISMSPKELEISITANSADGSSATMDGLTLENLSFQVYNFDTNGWENFYFISEIKDNQKEIVINLDDTLEVDKVGGKKSYSLKNKDETILKIKYEFEGYLLTKFINVRYGITKDQATLGVHANGITASIQNAGLVFDASGLTVKGGGLKIQNKQGEDTLSFAEESGDLIIKGTIEADGGYFKGRIEANEGSFRGSIEAGEGSIGGFVIVGDRLKAKDDSIVLISGSGEEGGKILANNIELGNGAKVNDQIQLGSSVVLSNPDIDTNAGSYLRVYDSSNSTESAQVSDDIPILINFTKNGTISVGNGEDLITINGAKGTMQSYNYNLGTGWMISNKESVFNNITVKGSIRASVLEYGEVQAVGGILMARPGSRIISAVRDGDLVEMMLEDIFGFALNDRCLITPDRVGEITKIWGTIKEIPKNTNVEPGTPISEITQKKHIKVQFDDNSLIDINQLVGLPIVSFGYINEGGEGVNNIGVGVNGSTNSAMIPAQAVSVFELNKKNEIDVLTPRIILGKIPTEKTYGSIQGSYGLYAENALLRGALITQTAGENPVYCGISTQYQDDAPMSEALEGKFKGFVPAEILFWAGAKGDSREAVQTAPFFVDRNGNFYSRNGYFKGSIITDSTIEAAEIKTAVLTGNAKKNEFALTIQNVNEGIVFRKNNEKDGSFENIFKLTGDGLSLKTKLQVVNEEENYLFQIDDSGKTVMSAGYVFNSDDALYLTDSSISLLTAFDKKSKEGTVGAKIGFEGKTIGLYADGAKEADFVVTEGRSEIRMDLYLGADSAIKYGEKMSHQPIKSNGKVIGYDLYIFD